MILTSWIGGFLLANDSAKTLNTANLMQLLTPEQVAERLSLKTDTVQRGRLGNLATYFANGYTAPKPEPAKPRVQRAGFSDLRVTCLCHVDEFDET